MRRSSSRLLVASCALAALELASAVSCSSSGTDGRVRAGANATPDLGPVNLDAARDAQDALTLCAFPPSPLAAPRRPLAILLFTKETQFFHTAAHAAGEVTVPAALRARGHSVLTTGDVETFTNEALSPYDVIVFFVTSGKVLVDPRHRSALEKFVLSGRGIAGAHTATATDLDWVDARGRHYMNELFGAAFKGHGGGAAQISEAGLVVDASSSIAAFLPTRWVREADEWYFYHVNPATRPEVSTVVWLDEAWLEPHRPSYPAEGFYGDAGHPISWTKNFDCSRVFYTAMGHNGEAWNEDLMIRHFVAGIEWAGAPSSEYR